MRIALLGGSFDPIHNGHLFIAKTAIKKLNIDQVWFLPCKDAPLKSGQYASFKNRCEMIRNAIKPYRKMKLCKIEGELEGISYTIRTVKKLKKMYPNDTFMFLIGDDQAKKFHLWKQADELLNLVEFYVFSREENVEIPKNLNRVHMELIDVSSTEIRAGKKHWLLPKSVQHYIGEHYLYLEQAMPTYMSAKRYMHSKSVAKLCVELARAHNLDENIAWCMGMTHDVCKQLPEEKAKIWMLHHMPKHINEASAIWHGYIGADYVKRGFHINNKDVISSIYHHVLGDGNSPYNIILYVADKLDPSRGYDSSEQIELCKKSLSLGFQRVKKEQEEYLRNEGVI